MLKKVALIHIEWPLNAKKVCESWWGYRLCKGFGKKVSEIHIIKNSRFQPKIEKIA